MRENALFRQSRLKVSIAAEEMRERRPAEKTRPVWASSWLPEGSDGFLGSVTSEGTYPGRGGQLPPVVATPPGNKSSAHFSRLPPRNRRAALGKVTLARAGIGMRDGDTRPRSVCLKINELFGESRAAPHTRGPH